MEDISERLSQALASRLALQMSISSLEVIEEWMDTPITRWLDSVPLPMEMPDGSSPPVTVTVGADGLRVRFSAGGAPEGVVPKLVDYLRRAGALPRDFALLDSIGQALEPREVGSWIEVRPGAVTTGWYLADDLPIAQLVDLFTASGSEEATWLPSVGATACHRLSRSVGANPTMEAVLLVDGGATVETGAGAGVASAIATSERLGFAIDHNAASMLGAPIELAIGAGGGAVSHVALAGDNPSGGQDICWALAISRVPAIDAVGKAIAAASPSRVAMEASSGGPAVLIELHAGSATALHLN